MYKELFNCVLLGLLFASCSGVKPRISVVCEENKVGNCIVKWETIPALEGDVKVYVSTDPENIPEEEPVASAPIGKQWMTVVTDDPTKRYLHFNRPVEGVRHVRLVVTEITGGGRSVGAAEWDVF